MELNDNNTYNYASLLRKIFRFLENRYQKKKVKNPRTESKVFGIDPNYTAETFLSGIFLLEDTSQAIDNYFEFGLEGPTKYKNFGERYLRLYGLLNSAYMQYVC
ncbi:MAG: hypothetical protein AAGA02_13735 [Bacteroidota bacterium]